MRYFAAVVEAGSLTAAAAALHMSQPSLSVAITKLESEVGVQLIRRSTRGVQATSAGRFLLDASTRVLGDVDDMLATLARFGSGTAGSVTIAAVPVLMWHRLPKLVRTHAAVVPEIDVRLVDPPPWTAIDMLQQGKVDLAAILVSDHRQFAQRLRGEFEIVDWGDVPLVAALPPERADAASPFPLLSFNDADVVMPRSTAAVPSLPEAIDAAFERYGIEPARVRTAETIQASVPLIEAGVAWGILPDPDRSSLARFDLTVRTLHPAPAPLRALVLSRIGAASDPALAGLLSRIAGEASENRV